MSWLAKTVKSIRKTITHRPAIASLLRISRRQASFQRLTWRLAGRSASSTQSTDSEAGTEATVAIAGAPSRGSSRGMSTMLDSPPLLAAQADARIDDAVQQVDYQVHRLEEHPVKEEDGHDDRVVSGQHALHEVAAHARHPED